MPRSRKPNGRRIKTHRSYTVEETARTVGVAKGTVRRWLKGGLPALTDQRPTLILGVDLAQFFAAAKRPRQTCQLNECYCVKCRAPRRPAYNMADYIPLTPINGNLRAICPDCATLMHKRIRGDALETLSKVLSVSIRAGN